MQECSYVFVSRLDPGLPARVSSAKDVWICGMVNETGNLFLYAAAFLSHSWTKTLSTPTQEHLLNVLELALVSMTQLQVNPE